MDHTIDNLLFINDPLKLIKHCIRTEISKDIYEDCDSVLWQRFIKNYFSKFLKYKLSDLKYKDYYVLLYYLDKFKLLNSFNMLMRGQNLLCLLPKIYDGDHVAIIHAISNIAITSNSSNIVMYRDYNEKNLPIFGNGYLIIQFRNTDIHNNKDIYLKKKELCSYKYSKHVHPYYGGVNAYL